MNTEQFKSLSPRQRATDLAANIGGNTAALEQRINFTQQTIRNTMVKLGHLRRPEYLTWALSRNARYRILGITTGPLHESWPRGRYEDITSKVRDGQITPLDGHTLHVAILYANGGISQAYIPLHLLSNDPIAIAQYTRRHLVEHENATRRAELRYVEREHLDKQRERDSAIKRYEHELAALDTKLATARRPIKPKVRQHGTRQPAGV